MNSRIKTFLLWMVIIIAFLFVAHTMKEQKTVETLDLTQLFELGEKGKADDGKTENTVIIELIDQDGSLRGTYIDPAGKKINFKAEYTVIGGLGRDILAMARENNVPYTFERRNTFLYDFLPQILLMVVLFGLLWLFLARQFQSGSNKAMSFGKSRAKLHTEGQVKESFDDVAGIDEVKEELQEIIQFLKDPDKYSRLGGKIPSGALLYGPPGTGKTLIARATAGEASVPFFSISGSDFVEMFVGVGASRVRDLFEQGKKAKPCIIYIDEIDAVGRSRFSGMGGGHDEREQTLNALLVELDGFAPNEGVIVMASTNRPDVLDPALLRPGRFDRQIRVDLADQIGREKILEVHTKPLKMAEEISLRDIARGTPGFSGADLANLANEAALLAARNDKKSIGMEELEEAKDRVMMGPARRSLAMSEKELTHTAYHEIGHALVAKLTKSDAHKVHKVTIIPRGRSLGLTAILPEEDLHSQNSKQLTDTLLYMMGGRAAEEIQFGDTSTGAANDLQRATGLAHKMICEFGMSETLGPRTFGSASGPLFVGRDMVRERDFSEETSRLIDLEVQKLINDAYAEAKDKLLTHKEEFQRASLALLERETLTGEELDKLVAGEDLPPLFNKDNSDDKHPDTPDTQPDPDETKKTTLSTTPPPLLDPPSVQPS